MTVKCVLADPFPLVRAGLRAMFAAEPDLWIVAEAGSAEGAAHLVRLHRPDVLIADLAAESLADVCQTSTAVLAFTDAADDEFLLTAIRAGIRGYVPKTASPDELIRVVRGIACGHTIFGPHVAAKVTRLLGSSA